MPSTLRRLDTPPEAGIAFEVKEENSIEEVEMLTIRTKGHQVKGSNYGGGKGGVKGGILGANKPGSKPIKVPEGFK